MACGAVICDGFRNPWKGGGVQGAGGTVLSAGAPGVPKGGAGSIGLAHFGPAVPLEKLGVLGLAAEA